MNDAKYIVIVSALVATVAIAAFKVGRIDGRSDGMSRCREDARQAEPRRTGR